MPAPTDKIVLPPKYYLDYFKYLLGFVQRKYSHILIESEREFLVKFELLSEDAQCLYVRFSNRSGKYFRTSKLKYEEIADIENALESLTVAKMAVRPDGSHAAETEELLQIFNKAELVQFCKACGLASKGLSAYAKNEVVQYILQNIEYEVIVKSIVEFDSVVRLNFEPEVQMLKYLFFGNRYDTMTEFVTRDLGFQRYEQYDEEKLVAHFNTRQEAEDKLAVSLFAEKFFEIAENLPAKELYYWAVNWMVLHGKDLSEMALTVLERQKLKFATFFEKIKEPAVAFDMYALTELPPSRERRVRILAKLGHEEEARELAESMLAEPYNNDEYFFAIDYKRKLEAKQSKAKNKRSVTIQLHDSEAVSIAADWRNRVEAGVIDYYKNLGYEAVFSENYLWKTLFGLLFWDIIYDTETLAIHHPLQRAPSDIYKPIFFESRREKLLDRLDILEDKEELSYYVRLIFKEKAGITNPLVDWQETTLETVLVLCERLTAFQMRSVLLEMATNLKQNTHGFPDLFIWNAETYHFIEVKSPTDNLSNQQLFWLRYFERIELNAKVLRVLWA